MSEPDLRAQADEVELQRLGLQDLYDRATTGKIRRSPTEIDRMRERLAALTAASRTMADLAALHT